jgi:3-hydroxyisobutyrate dehydrogenase
MSVETVGVVGLGAMGLPMAAEARSGFRVVGYDVDEARREAFADAGGEACDSLRAVAAEADLVLLSLPSGAAVRSVATGEDGVVDALDDGDVLVNTSTVSLDLTDDLATACDRRDLAFLDAPVHGGPRNADGGTLTFLVGGPDDVLEATRDVLATMAETVHHVGPHGTGTAMKLATNYMFGAQQLALCEALAMTRAAGVDDETFAAVAPDTSGDCYALDRDMERFVIPRRFEPEARQRIVRKDVKLAERMASTLDVPLLSGGTSDVYRYAERSGLADEDTAALVKLFEFE